jgi:hypothetical protein
MPERFSTSLKYSQLLAITTAGVGVPGYQVFRMNSIYDPDLSGVGHQPLGHDELIQFYNKYVVKAITWSVTYSNQSTTDYADVAVVARPNVSTMSLMSTVFESPFVRGGTVGPETGTRNILTLTGSMSVAKVRGVTPQKVLMENEYAALVGATPAIVPTLQLYVENQNTIAAITIVARTEIRYIVDFYDRKALPGS